MQDDDWMVPRRLHTGQAEEVDERPKAQNLKIDPQFLRRRELRRQSLSPQPKGPAKPWLDVDRSIARSLPSFPDRMWTLGDTARWVIERTPEAVNGLSIDEEKLFEVLPEIHTALSAGEISVFANTENDPVPRELPAQTWSVYELLVEEKNGLIRIFPSSSSSSDYEQHLLNLRVKRDDVLQRWPDPSHARKPVQPTTTGAENQCRRWLAAMMKNAPTQPRPKAAIREEALAKFPGLAKRGFDRAWDAAIRETNARKWGAPGRRS
ncbi:MAG TPA: hypothetical protein VK512_00330 [Xanthobacteraceae bacterium]|jgi:hypothetical protein|nr:hypothetical protein [Xanthobacteraceae bacterium]